MSWFSSSCNGRRWNIAIVVVLGAIAALLLFSLRREKLPPVVALSQPYRLPVPLSDRLLGWIPVSWGWFWRLRQTVLGRVKPINLRAEVVEIITSSSEFISSLGLGTPKFSDTNGLQIWFVPKAELKAVRAQMNQIPGADVIDMNRAMISTGYGVGASLFCGQSISNSQVGFAFECLPRQAGTGTDLTTIVRISELVTNQTASGEGATSGSVVVNHTNLEAGARMQIPDGQAALLVGAGQGELKRKRFFIIIEGSPPGS